MKDKIYYDCLLHELMLEESIKRCDSIFGKLISSDHIPKSIIYLSTPTTEGDSWVKCMFESQ